MLQAQDLKSSQEGLNLGRGVMSLTQVRARMGLEQGGNEQWWRPEGESHLGEPGTTPAKD